jgi:hypothetical protein|tara:strand:+ start:527 stop:748 length:222 start_codon:yes stop_codon:yes gene_type:complete
MPISDEEGQALIQEEQEYRAREYQYNLKEANLEEAILEWHMARVITNLELEVKALSKQIRLLEIEVRGWKKWE